MFLESIPESGENDQGDRLLQPSGEAADVEKGRRVRPRMVGVEKAYNKIRLRVRRQWLDTPMLALIVIAILFASLMLDHLVNGSRRHASKPFEVVKWTKPEGFKIIGLVFFGRLATVEILGCYLKQNLVSNGGYLDEVQFIALKASEETLAWLDQQLLTTHEYRKVVMEDPSFEMAWNNTVERGNMYIKIDDDLVFLSDDAIPQLVYSKIKHPEALNIAANLINAAELGWIHYHLGAIHSYYPETERSFLTLVNDESCGPAAWRASALPTWNATGKEKATPGIEGTAPPYKGHRWLPVRQNDTGIAKTPIAGSVYTPNSPNWRSWTMGAQTHYSFLENLETNQLDRFHFGPDVDGNGREAIWNMAYERMNINLLAMWGDDVRDYAPFGQHDDEAFLTVDLPRRINRPCLVNTYVIAVHFSFSPQTGIYDTDLLSRYRAYANEMVCTANNQIRIDTGH